MESKFILFTYICTIFCIQCKISAVNAMVGRNVRPVEPREFSYVVSLVQRYPESFIPTHNYICTAALITRTHVLSAAHCIANRLKSQSAILIGSTRLSHCRVYGILWWIDYNTWGAYSRIYVRFESNDICIIKLDRETDNDIVPGVLSPLHNQDLFGQNGVIAGWGRTNNGEIPNNMLKATLKFLTLDECIGKIEIIEGRRVPIHNRHLCTDAFPFILLHEGDSGGPVVFNNMIVGVNIATCPLPHILIHPGKVNLHLGIDYYRTFIAAVTLNNFTWQ